MGQWRRSRLLWWPVMAVLCCCGENVQQKKLETLSSQNEDNEVMVESIDPRCGAVATENGCVIHKIRATAGIFDALGEPVVGPLYYAIYVEQKVELNGPGTNTPDYSFDPTDVGLHSPSEVVEIVCGDIKPGEYETLAFVDIDMVVDPNNRVGPSGAPSTVPGPTYTIVAGHTTTIDLPLQLLLP